MRIAGSPQCRHNAAQFRPAAMGNQCRHAARPIRAAAAMKARTR
jgi:hypothetical protein